MDWCYLVSVMARQVGGSSPHPAVVREVFRHNVWLCSWLLLAVGSFVFGASLTRTFSDRDKTR